MSRQPRHGGGDDRRVSPGNLYAGESISIDTHSPGRSEIEQNRPRTRRSKSQIPAPNSALSIPSFTGLPNLAMMKFAAFLSMMMMMVCLAQCQRPPYAGSSNKWPVVLPQYLEGRETTPPAPSTPTTNTDDALVNRIDAQEAGNRQPGSGSAFAAAPSPASAPTNTDVPLDLPVDARGDIELINRIKTWPRDKQPFWFINWQQIQEQRGDSRNPGQASAAPVNTRSFFSG